MGKVNLDNQISNQLYMPKQGQQQFQPKQNAVQSNQSYGGAKDIAKNNTNAGYIASKFDVMEHPWVLAKNMLLGLATAVGITAFGEYLVTGNFKKLPDNISVNEAFMQTPLHKFGIKLDNMIKNIPVLQKTVDRISNLATKISKSKKPKVIEEIIQKFKEGSKVTWAMGKTYEKGKSAEALDSLINFLEETPKGTFTDAKTEEAVKNILSKVKSGELQKYLAGRQIVEQGYLEKGISAKHLSKLEIGQSKGINKFFDKLFGTTPNLYSALSKAKFFDNQTKALGPISKALNKLTLIILEGTGGALLGGKIAIIMSLTGLVTAFNAISKANVAKKEKQKQLAQGNMTPEQMQEMEKKPRSGEMVAAFMEDFAGFTLAGYLMPFPIGLALNKALGLANLGRDDKAVKDAAAKMGIKNPDKLYQNSIIKYNETIKQDKIAKAYMDYLNGKSKLPLMKRFAKATGFSSDLSIQAKMIEKLKLRAELGISANATEEEVLNILKNKPKNEILKALSTKVKGDKWFEETRKMLKTAGKSNLTLKSVFSGKEGLIKYLIQKPLELAAKMLGPDKFLMYKHNAKFTNIFRSLIKGGGGIGRIVLVGMVLTVPFRNAFMKASHFIFGKPSFSQYDEVKGLYDDKEEDLKKAESQEIRPQSEFKKIKLPMQAPMQMMNVEPKTSETNSIPAYKEKSSISNPYQNQIKSQDNYSYIPKNEIIEKNDSPVRELDTYTYMPN